MYNSDDLQNNINSSILAKRFLIRNNILNIDCIRDIATSNKYRFMFNTIEVLNVDLKGTDYCVTVRVMNNNPDCYLLESFMKKLIMDQILTYYHSDISKLCFDFNSFFNKLSLSDNVYFNLDCIESKLWTYLSSMFFIEKYPQNIYIIRI